MLVSFRSVINDKRVDVPAIVLEILNRGIRRNVCKAVAFPEDEQSATRAHHVEVYSRSQSVYCFESVTCIHIETNAVLIFKITIAFIGKNVSAQYKIEISNLSRVRKIYSADSWRCFSPPLSRRRNAVRAIEQWIRLDVVAPVKHGDSCLRSTGWIRGAEMNHTIQCGRTEQCRGRAFHDF